MIKGISYKSGFKYQLVKEFRIQTGILIDHSITTRFIDLGMDGILVIKPGYAWDGASGPAIDTTDFMRGSLVHDALYQLMRNDYLIPDTHRDDADRLLQRMCKQDGMPAIRAWWVYKSLKWFGFGAASDKNKRAVMVAP